jgi:hypothetical protein
MSAKELVAVKPGTSSGEDSNGSLIRRECNDPVFLCLVSYWTTQGLTSDQAETAAYKALERLRDNIGCETWCLLP